MKVLSVGKALARAGELAFGVAETETVAVKGVYASTSFGGSTVLADVKNTRIDRSMGAPRRVVKDPGAVLELTGGPWLPSRGPVVGHLRHATDGAMLLDAIVPG